MAAQSQRVLSGLIVLRGRSGVFSHRCLAHRTVVQFGFRSCNVNSPSLSSQVTSATPVDFLSAAWCFSSAL